MSTAAERKRAAGMAWVDRELTRRGLSVPGCTAVTVYAQVSPSTIAARAHAAADASMDWAAYFARWDELSAMLEGCPDSDSPPFGRFKPVRVRR